jgi:putative resolvase
MSRLIKIGEAASLLGVSVQTLRKWERTGELTPDRKSQGGIRYYDLDRLLGKRDVETDLTIAYARVSSHDQKDDLKRQAQSLESYCTAKGWTFEVIQDLGSGMNYRKRGLKRLLDLIINRRISRLVLTHKDRLLRFGAELVFTLCEARQVEVVIINQGEEVSYEEELAQDVLEIITVFSARLYGSRSHKNSKLVKAARVLAE